MQAGSGPGALTAGAGRAARDFIDRYHWQLVVLVLLSGILLRVYWITSVVPSINADDALVGVTAMRMLKGEPHLFYFVGHGTFAAFVTAVAFAFFGTTVTVMKMVSLCFSVITCLGVYFFGRWAVRKEIGLLALLWVSLSPSALTLLSIKPEPGYVELLATATWGLALTVLLLSGRLTEKRWQIAAMAGVGLTLGLSWWVSFATGIYLLAIGLVAMFEWRVLLRLPPLGYVLLAGYGFFTGWAPYYYRLIFWPQYNPLNTLFTPGHAAPNAHNAMVRLVQENLPAVLGVRHYMTDLPPTIDIFPPAVGSLVLIFFLIVLIWCVVQGWLIRAGTCRLGMRLATSLVALLFASFVFSSYGSAPASVRFQYPLYSVLPVIYACFLAYGLGRSKFARLISVGLLGALLLVNIYGSLTYPGNYELYGHKPGDEEALLRFLTVRNIRYIHTTYWIQMPVALVGQEIVVPSGRAGFWGAPLLSYDEMVLGMEGEQTAYVLHHGAKGELVFAQSMNHLALGYKQTTIGCYTVFYGFSRFPKVYELNLPLDWASSTTRAAL